MKKKVTNFHLLFLLLVLSTSYLTAQTTWNGLGGDTAWDNPLNWTAGVPDASDHVTIPGGAIVVISTPALAKSIVNHGDLTIQINSSLTIVGSTEYGIDNYGSVNNAGDINIDNTGNRGIHNRTNSNFTNNNNIFIGQNGGPGNITYDGIINYSVFNNNGQLTIDNVSEEGLSNWVGGDFTNTGTIDIGQNGGSGNISRSGIANGYGGVATFTNTGGTINIDNTGTNGIINSNGTFTNSATINIGKNAGNIGHSGIYQPGGSFTNDGGTIDIDNVDLFEGIHLTNSTFENKNNGQVFIGQVNGIGRTGLYTSNATFTNTNGTINIKNTGGYGINNVNTSTFNNNGDIHIDNAGNRGIDNRGHFTNNNNINIGQNGGAANITYDGIINYSVFDNNGHLTIDNVGEEGISNWIGGDFTNTGIIDIGQNGGSGNISRNGIANGYGGAATFTNTGGTINIDNTGTNGIINSNGTFTNSATINIGKNAGNIGHSGIYQPGGSFTNDGGTIDIDNVVLFEGIHLAGSSFENKNNGQIFIGQANGVGGHGLYTTNATFINNGSLIIIDNTGSTGITNNNGTFDNFAIINIGYNAGNIGYVGLSNQALGTFNNNAGFINIDNTGADGLYNDSGSFTNAATINIGLSGGAGSITADGLENNSTFNNNSGGVINIDNTGSGGIFNNRTFTNKATINIGQNGGTGNIAQDGIGNVSTFSNEAGTINIDNTGNNGIVSVGIFTNQATINIGQNGGAGNISNWGIEILGSGSTFNNDAGMINIDNTGSNGIYNSNDAIFSNKATIEIDNTGENGIYNLATFTNEATINIGQSGGTGNITKNGIINTNTFTNNTGVIGIDNTAESGIYNQFIFTNMATLNVGQNGTISSAGIRTFSGTFVNDAGTVRIDNALFGYRTDGTNNITTNKNGGQLLIGQLGTSNIATGLTLFGNNFTNDGSTIKVDNILSNGIAIKNFSFVNKNNGQLLIGQSGMIGEAGIFLFSAANFENEGGTIRIDNSRFGITTQGINTFTNKMSGQIVVGQNVAITDRAIVNLTGNIINNEACAEIHLFEKLQNNGTMTNAGLFRINTANASSPGNFTNNGVIVDVQGTLAPGVTNNDLIIAPIAGECTIMPALQIGGMNDFTPTSEWFTDPALTNKAGDYVVNTFSVTNLNEGVYTLFFTASGNGCTFPLSIQVNYDDVTKPTPVCKNKSLQLDAFGNGSIVAADVYDAMASTDNCGTVNLVSFIPGAFTCADVGANTVTVTVNDGLGNTATCSATVNVVDNLAPTPVCPTNIPDVVLDANGNGTLPANIGVGNSTDNCSATETSPTMNFSCSDVGVQMVELTVTDGTNTVSTNCSFNVVDNTLPTPTCLNPSVQLGATGNYALTQNDVYGGGTDNCTTVNFWKMTPAAVDCSQAGTTVPVLVEVFDASGNQADCTSNVTVEDAEAPVAVCPANIPDVLLNASGNGSLPANIGDGSSTDNCSAVETSPAMTFNCSAGPQMVTLTVTDGFNTVTANCAFNVVDNQAPVAHCPANIPDVQLDASGNGSLPANIGDGSSTDNCLATETSPALNFTCADVGFQTVLLTASDGTNSSTINCSFNVVDNVLPTANCVSQTIQATLNANAQYTVDPNQLNENSTDACGIQALSASPALLDCQHEGTNTVTLTVADVNGNTATCTATVAVAEFLAITNVSETPETCAGMGDGGITVTATAGGGQVKYSIDGGASFQFSGVFQNLTPGTYNVVAKVFGVPSVCEKTTVATVAAGGSSTTWYKDTDGDGYTDGISQTSCTQPSGYIGNPLPGTDCDDYDPLAFPGQTWYEDLDGDGYGSGVWSTACQRPAGCFAAFELAAVDTDCDDNEATVNPAATEICDGLDNDCDGETDEGLSGVYVGNLLFTTQAQLDAWPACYDVIQGNVTIQGGNIADLSPLGNIVEITGNLMIVTNSVLTSLDGLENLADVGGALYMYYNFQLSDCCAIDNLLTGNGVGGTVVIFFNAPGSHCNSAAAIMAACPVTPLIVDPNDNASPNSCIGCVSEGSGRLSLLPNPASGRLVVKIPRNFENGDITIFDIQGRAVVERAISDSERNHQFDVSVLPGGLYMVIVKLEGQQLMVEKLIVE